MFGDTSFDAVAQKLDLIRCTGNQLLIISDSSYQTLLYNAWLCDVSVSSHVCNWILTTFLLHIDLTLSVVMVHESFHALFV